MRFFSFLFLLLSCCTPVLSPYHKDVDSKSNLSINSEDRFLGHKFYQEFMLHHKVLSAQKNLHFDIKLSLDNATSSFNKYLDVTGWHMKLLTDLVIRKDGAVLMQEKIRSHYSYQDYSEVDNIFIKEKIIDYLIKDSVQQVINRAVLIKD